MVYRPNNKSKCELDENWAILSQLSLYIILHFSFEAFLFVEDLVVCLKLVGIFCNGAVPLPFSIALSTSTILEVVSVFIASCSNGISFKYICLKS